MPLRSGGLADSVATCTRPFPRSGRLADPATGFTRMLPPDTDRCVSAPQRFIEADQNLVFEIRTAFRLPAAGPFAEDLTENFTEFGLIRAAEIEPLKRESPIG